MTLLQLHVCRKRYQSLQQAARVPAKCKCLPRVVEIGRAQVSWLRKEGLDDEFCTVLTDVRPSFGLLHATKKRGHS